ncbi:hypothetical protein GQ600_10315 [Phytophthora cactorum]|nr:hypothetical protein GQ600_10315 [Phytophthora cactorum]
MTRISSTGRWHSSTRSARESSTRLACKGRGTSTPRPSSSREEDSDSLEARSAVNSDEEWVDTASDASSATSSHFTDPSKADRRGSSPPRSTSNDSSDEGEEVLAAPPCRACAELPHQCLCASGESSRPEVCFEGYVCAVGAQSFVVEIHFHAVPQNRTAFKPEVLPIVNELRKAETKKNSILANINDHSV